MKTILKIFTALILVFCLTSFSVAQQWNIQYVNGGDTTITNSDTIDFEFSKPFEYYSGFIMIAGIHTSVSGTLSETVYLQGTNDDPNEDDYAPLWWNIDTTDVSVYTGYKFTITPPQYLYYRTRHISSGTMVTNVRERLIYKEVKNGLFD